MECTDSRKGKLFMGRAKLIACYSLILIIILQLSDLGPVLAAVNPPQPAPEKLRIEALHDTPPGDNQPSIGYNEFDKYYADLKSDPQKPPIGAPASTSTYLNYYLQEVNKPYKPAKPAILKEGNIPADMVSDNTLRMKGLSSGTIYYAYSRAYYTYTLENTTYTSAESVPSNTVKFLSDISISAASYGPNTIKIEWDDVWNSGRRIDYKLYISENSTFANTPAIYISNDQIGLNGPVTVNEASGKLEYIHAVRDPGRVYYIKVVPDINETELKRSSESPVVKVSSFILAKTTKMSATVFGTVWKLEWSPVVTGIGDSSIKVTYQIYKGTSDAGSIEQYVASVDDTVFFFTIKPEEKAGYYKIKALVTRNGQDVYPGVKIQSGKIYVMESEVPSTPSAPELVNEFTNAGMVVISYADRLQPDSAAILWRAPLKSNGAVDTDVLYDIWLINDPNNIDNPPYSALVASSLRMADGNFVMSGTRLLGYKYTINELSPNKTYYFKIIARKTFVEFADNVLVNKVYSSLPAIKAIITPADGPIDQPLVPGRPPMKIKTIEGREKVTGTTATIQLMNKWYEQYIISGGVGRWEFRTPAQLEEIQEGLAGRVENGQLTQAESLQYRKVEYDGGITFDVGCVKYTHDFDYSSLDKLPANKITGFSSAPNDPDENINDPDAIPDGKKHNVDITISGLEPNSTYIIWARAARRSEDLLSGPSDPLFVTTIPDFELPLEKPTVPVFNYNDPGDSYVDLGWNFVTGYKYYLKYGTKDNISSAKASIEINPSELEDKSFYRIYDLDPETIYYFWIQAEASNASGETSKSEWSDSLILKTLPKIAPSTPRGFGVKGTEGSITKNSITYEWIPEEGMEYYLEIASGINYEDAAGYEAAGGSEYKVQGLRSNFRYYARLYAYDPINKLKSQPTQSIIVRTERSGDEFDSDQDTENVFSGAFIIKAPSAVNRVWKIKITGVNADRFIQHIKTDNILDYSIDLSTTPKDTDRISLLISGKVFTALAQLKENLGVKTERLEAVIRPGVIMDAANNTAGDNESEQQAESIYEIAVVLNSTSSGTDTRNLTFRTPVTGLEINHMEGGIAVPFGRLEKPLRLVYEYLYPNWYKEGFTYGYLLKNNTGTWEKSVSRASYSEESGKGRLSFDSFNTGRVAVAEAGKDIYDDIRTNRAKSSIENIASVHELKFITGRKFEPGKYVTNRDAVKFILDMLNYTYGTDYMNIAVKSGLISYSDSKNPDALCAREKITAMAVRIYEIKASEKAAATRDETGVFKDIGQVNTSLLPKIKFAIENGIIISRSGNIFGPKDSVTRAETAVLLEKLLRLAGEL